MRDADGTVSDEEGVAVTITDEMAKALEEIRDRHIPDQPMADDSDEAEYARKHHTELRNIARAALTRYRASPPASDDVERVECPSEHGSFVGDVFFGDPSNSTRGTHRWDGVQWESLPSDNETLLVLLKKARAERDKARAALAAMGRDEGWRDIASAPKDVERVVAALRPHITGTVDDYEDGLTAAAGAAIEAMNYGAHKRREAK